METTLTRRIRNGIFILIVTGALFGVLFARSRAYEPLTTVEQRVPVLIGGTVPIPVSIAQTPETREQGLSDTLSLATNTGKLFIFDTPGRYGFWMKDMHYALDLIWIDSTLKVVDITSNVGPETYPQTFYPQADVLYVLEINADEAVKLGLVVGTQLSLQK